MGEEATTETKTGDEADKAKEGDDKFNALKTDISAAMKAMQEQSTASFDRLAESNKALASQLQVNQPKPKAESDENMADLWLTDPEAAAKKMRTEIKAEIKEERDTATTTQQTQASALQGAYAEMAKEFPELYQQGSELTTKANDLYNKDPNAAAGGAASVSACVYRAAMELGLKPISKREESGNEDFSGSSKDGTGNKNKEKKDDDKLDDKMLEFAAFMPGRDVTDPKYLAKLKKIKSEKKFGTWS